MTTGPPGVEPVHWVNDAIMDASEAVDKLAERVGKMTASEEPSDLVDVVKAGINLRAVIDQARDALSALLAYGHHLMPQNLVVLEGYGPVEKTGGWNRSAWEHEALLAKVVRWAKDDREAYAREHDGEAPPESEGETVARLLLEYAGIGYWKVKPPKEQRGLNVDEYCHKEPAPKGIRLPRREE